jgi:putative Mn2+ efflux pump MntP
MTALLLIALGLSMDAFAVSVSSGIVIRDFRFFHALRASFFFGLFQFFMPLAGWYLGSAFVSYIEAVDHWVAFGLLGFIGGKMIVEALRRRKDPPGHVTSGDIRSMKTLLVLSLATSVDALAAGVSLSIMGHGVWGSAAVIGGLTFLICLCGFEFGRRAGVMLEKWAQLAGGLILIAIGVRILAQHLGG